MNFVLINQLTHTSFIVSMVSGSDILNDENFHTSNVSTLDIEYLVWN